jgi:hypothetical protein
MNYAVEMELHAMIYIPRFIKIGSAIRKLLWCRYTYTDTHRQECDLICLLLFFQNKESKVKMEKSKGDVYVARDM